MRTLIRGAIAGAVATLPMSLFMLLAKRAGLMGEQPPEKITATLLRRAGVDDPDPAVQDALASAMHFGFGAASGTLFVFLRRLPLPVPAWVGGVAFGTLVWAVSYLGWIPAFRIMPPADRDRRGRAGSMLFAHWIYGAVLGLTGESESAHGSAARYLPAR